MKIVILDGQTLNPGDNPWTEIEQLGAVEIFARTPAEEIVNRLAGAQVAVTNKVPLDRNAFDALTDLQFVAVTATGFNVVDVQAAREKNIPVSNVPIYGTDTVAQHVFACLLSFLHQPYQHDAAVRNGEWERRGDFSFCLHSLTELAGLTMGIVGYGRIGNRVAEIASAFGMQVIAYNPSSKPAPDLNKFEWVSNEELFARSDVVSLNCPQTSENARFVNCDLISTMKPTAILINASRGGLINESDLAEALNQDKLAGAILDVFSTEPISRDNPLAKAKNCLITPHNAWATVAARNRLMKTTADNIRAFQTGNPINVIN